MGKPKSGIAERLQGADVAVSNALADAEIGKLMGEYGYTTSRLTEGKVLFDAASGAVKAQVAAAGAHKEATQRALAAAKGAQAAYQDLAQVARAAFKKSPETLAVIGLKGGMPKSTALFLTMATALFDNAASRPDTAEVLKQYGYNQDKLSKGRAKIVELGAAEQAQASAAGAAQQATAEQERCLKSLDDWMGAFTRIARVALKDKPQLLEKLGILKRSGKTQAQRQGPAKAAATRKAKEQQRAS